MNFVDRNFIFSFSMNFEKGDGPCVKFRWSTHIALPFPFPSKEIVSRSAEIGGRQFDLTFRNDLNRVVAKLSKGPGTPYHLRVILEPKAKQQISYPGCESFTRDELQSVVTFRERREYEEPRDAFHDASTKIRECYEWLGAFLSACQREAPYLASWLIYPVSHFEVGTTYHQIHGWCTRHNRWEPFGSAAAVSMSRHLQNPLFFMKLPDRIEVSDPVDTANELLAEAQMSRYRGLTRLAVLNSYAAAESYANAVFKKIRVANLVAHGATAEVAEEQAEKERKAGRTDGRFLFHLGPSLAVGRSLHDEKESLYQALVGHQGVQDVRHKVAHTGYKPSATEAENAHKRCCEAVQWLAEIAGAPIKPMVPADDDSIPGFSASLRDGMALARSDIDVLRFFFGLPASKSKEGPIWKMALLPSEIKAAAAAAARASSGPSPPESSPGQAAPST